MKNAIKEHQLICSCCGQVIDMRDLSQVFAHEPCDGFPKDYNNIEKIQHSEGNKIKEIIAKTKDNKPIYLNFFPN